MLLAAEFCLDFAPLLSSIMLRLTISRLRELLSRSMHLTSREIDNWHRLFIPFQNSFSFVHTFIFVSQLFINQHIPKSLPEMKFKPALLHFKFNEFEYLLPEPGLCVSSETQTDCNGHKWSLSLYPGGDTRNEEPGWVSLFLCSVNDSSLDVNFALSIKDVNEGTVRRDTFTYKFDVKGSSRDNFFGGLNLLKQSEILDSTKNILKDGALLVDITIQVKDDKNHLFQPPSEHCKKQLNMLKSGKNTDTSLKVGRKVFRVHFASIDAHAPLLGNQCGGTIKGIKPDVFQLLLEYIYSGLQPVEEQIFKYGKELIDAANKYELVELKMFVENVLVQERVLTTENVAEYILFADAQSCPLLKEYAISFFSAHCREVLLSEHSKCLKESGELLSEVILLMNPSWDVSSEGMDVNELRKELGKRKLDVDGTKDALVSRLEDAKRQKTD